MSSTAKKMTAGVLLAAGLSLGGYAYASAQDAPSTTTPSTTDPNTTDPNTSTTVPWEGADEAPADGLRDRHCDHGGEDGGSAPSTEGSATNTGSRSV